MTDRLLSYRGAVELTSLSEATLRRMVKDGRLPKPVTLTPGRVVFREVDLRAACERLIAGSQRSAAA